VLTRRPICWICRSSSFSFRSDGAELARAAATDELAIEGIRGAVDICLGAIAAAADQYRARARTAQQTLQEAAT
jgi:hypothetical protein